VEVAIVSWVVNRKGYVDYNYYTRGFIIKKWKTGMRWGIYLEKREAVMAVREADTCWRRAC
jgi:hypothetical protein